MWIAILKFFGKEFLKKHWKTIVALLALYYTFIFLFIYAVIQALFWHHYDCKPQMGLYQQDANGQEAGDKCSEDYEVLTYEVNEEEDVISLGERIRKARDEVMEELIDEEAIGFLKKYDIEDTTLDYPGDAYRLLTPAQADGLYNTPVATNMVQNATGRKYVSGDPHIYDPSYTVEDYWVWANEVYEVTGWDPLLVLAQWTQEIGRDFHSNNFAKNNNMGGQTWHKGLPESMKGTPRPSGEGGYYIKYDDALDGYIDFLLSNPRYSKVPTYKTAEEQAAEVARQGWAKDPNYLKALNSLIKEYRGKFGNAASVNATTEASVIATISETTPIEENTTEDTTVEDDKNGDLIVEIAYRYYKEMGKGSANPVNYVMGGDNLKPGGRADCSDFSQAVYKEAGISIGGYTVDQMYNSGGEFVDGAENLAPGDLLFFHNNNSSGHGYAQQYNGKTYRVSHVGVYVGEGKFIHLSYGKGTIDIDDVTTGYYKEHFIVGKRWIGPGTGSYQAEMEAATINQAEIHLRGLTQADMHVLEAVDLDKEQLESGKYDDTKLFKTWLVTKIIQKKGKEAYEADDTDSPYYEIYKRSVEVDEKDVGQSWVDRNMNWLLFTQYEAYKCYILGDDKKDDLGDLIKAFFLGLFGLGDYPCKTLDELYEEGGGSGAFIDKKHRNQVQKQHVIIEDRWECVEKGGSSPYKEGPAEKQGYNEYIPPGAKPDCGSEMEAIIARQHTSYNTYQKLIEMLYDFEPYAMHEMNITIDEKDEDYPGLIKFIVGEVEGETANGQLTELPNAEWIVPMEQGTYNFSSPFGMRTYKGETKNHDGIDMGTRETQRVPVYASAAGTVVGAGETSTGYGAVVTIDHGNGYYSMYAHFLPDDIVVESGQQVEQAQLLGGAGNNPAVDWHLHFEICKEVYDGNGGVKMCKGQEDPEPHLSGLSTDQDDTLTVKRANQFTGAKDYDGEEQYWNKMKERAKTEVILMPGYTPNSETVGGGKLGDWVKEFESGKKGPSAYDDNEKTGNTLGTYQMVEKDANGNKGSLYGFGDYLQSKYPAYYEKLSPYDPSTKGYVDRWIALGNADPSGFEQAQYEYIKQTLFDPVVNSIKSDTGVEVEKRSRGLQEAIWSSAVQTGNITVSHFKEAVEGKDASSMTDADILKTYYDVKIKKVPSTFSKFDAKTHNSIINRYNNERDKLLENMSKCGC